MNLMTLKIRALVTAFVILVLTGCGGGGISGSGGSGAAAFGTGTASLSWLPPTENTDGSTLSNLAGYNIYYGTEIGNYTEVISVNNAGITSYVIDNLPAGNTYFFVITAFDSDGLQSEYSAVGSKTIIA